MSSHDKNADDYLLDGNESECGSIDGNVSATEERKLFDEMFNVDETFNRKTRATSNKPGRIIKGTATVKEPVKTVKRKANKTNSSQPTKLVKKSHTFSEKEVTDLRKKMGIDTLADSVSQLVKSLSQPKPVENVPQESRRPILSLDPDLNNDSVVDNFDLNYFDQSPMAPDNTTFNPASGFAAAF